MPLSRHWTAELHTSWTVMVVKYL